MFSKLDDQRLLTLERFYSTNEIFSETTHLLVRINRFPNYLQNATKQVENPDRCCSTATQPVTHSFHRFRKCSLDFHNSRISADVQPKHISQAYKEFRVIPCSRYLFLSPDSDSLSSLCKQEGFGKLVTL